MTRVSPEWLARREPADAAARSAELVEELRARLAGDRPVVVHDLGCGSGSMGRWLAPLLPGPQHWVLYDHDDELLERAEAAMAGMTGVATVRTRRCDVTRLVADDLAGASVITASALLDMLTQDELDRMVAACVGAGCPALLTISVIGLVELDPFDPLDPLIGDAFNAHQRRTAGVRTLLGPDAVDVAIDAFTQRGATVLVRSTPWRIGSDHSELVAEWFDGWIGAAAEQRPKLTDAIGPYAQRRRAQLAAGRLAVVVHHRDLIAIPEPPLIGPNAAATASDP